MRVLDVMTEGVETADPSEAAQAAWERMHQAHLRHLVVVRGQTPVGLLSDLELGTESEPQRRAGKTVAEVMTPQIVTVTRETPLRRAANMLKAKRAACLPVMNGKKLIGLVTATDLLEQLGRGRGNKARPLPRIRSSRRPQVGAR